MAFIGILALLVHGAMRGSPTEPMDHRGTLLEPSSDEGVGAEPGPELTTESRPSPDEPVEPQPAGRQRPTNEELTEDVQRREVDDLGFAVAQQRRNSRVEAVLRVGWNSLTIIEKTHVCIEYDAVKREMYEALVASWGQDNNVPNWAQFDIFMREQCS